MIMKAKYIISVILGILFLNGCNYLDIVPDNIPTIEHAFGSRAEAEKFLFTCYSSLPLHAEPDANPAFLAGDEMTVYPIAPHGRYKNLSSVRISRGEQSATSPLTNYWDGSNGGKNLFVGLRNCNIFIEKIGQVKDIEEFDRARWIAEVKFLKAYYHFFLMRLYGPIPLIKDNIPINAKPEEIMIYREPVDDVVDYICDLIDEAIPDLPSTVIFSAEEDGRITKSVALAIKAKALLWAASPLFNGNEEYADFTDNRGVSLISQQYQAAKWDLVRDAAKAAIDEAVNAGHRLYYWTGPYDVTDSTKYKMNIREAFCDPWNSETIWGGTDNTDRLQLNSQARLAKNQNGGNRVGSYNSPTLRMVELFYTDNGIPIGEDPEYYTPDKWYKLRKAGDEDRYYIEKGWTTVNIHFNREPRFYGNLAFDGSKWYGNGRTDDNDIWTTGFKKGEPAGIYSVENTNATGYLPKKHVSYRTNVTESNFTAERYPFPIIRMAELYLIYAEALNESQGPGQEVYNYLDPIRERAGLKGVVESWRKSVNPDKPQDKEGLREIIRQERLIELAFEGSRFYDLRRWKLARDFMNKPMKGWSIFGETADEFYIKNVVNNRKFRRKDYLWPIKESNLYRNNNLLQNPDW